MGFKFLDFGVGTQRPGVGEGLPLLQVCTCMAIWMDIYWKGVWICAYWSLLCVKYVQVAIPRS